MECKAHGADFNCVQTILNININTPVLNKWKRLSQSGSPSKKKQTKPNQNKTKTTTTTTTKNTTAITIDGP